jgi:hypothetical protein
VRREPLGRVRERRPLAPKIGVGGCDEVARLVPADQGGEALDLATVLEEWPVIGGVHWLPVEVDESQALLRECLA